MRNASSYDKMYGEGAWGQTLNFLSSGDNGSIDRWSQGFTSLENGIYVQVSSDKIVGSNSWSGLFSNNNNLSGNEVLCVKISFGNKATGKRDERDWLDKTLIGMESYGWLIALKNN